MVQLHESWLQYLGSEFEKDYMKKVKEVLIQEKEAGKTIYPASSAIFHAFNTTSFDDVKVVILGQDPYHGPGQAHGLSFSVPKGVTPPPSLKNMYKELWQSGEIDEIPNSGDLTHWAQQGVLLLNAILTVRANEAASHRDIGWQEFTDTIISLLSQKRDGLVFLLWGSFAQSKLSLIDQTKHHVLLTTHPSPLSAYRGFLGSGCFKQANELLEKGGKEKIVW